MTVPEECASAGGHDVDEEEPEEEINPGSSEEPSPFLYHAPNSTHFRSRYPFAFRHPARGGSHVRVPSHSRVRRPRHKSRVHQPANRTRRVTQDMKKTTASRWLPCCWLSQPLPGRTCRALRVTPSSYWCGRQHPQASTAPNLVSPASGRSYGQATTNVRGHRQQLRQRWLGSLTGV